MAGLMSRWIAGLIGNACQNPCCFDGLIRQGNTIRQQSTGRHLPGGGILRQTGAQKHVLIIPGKVGRTGISGVIRE